MKVAVLINRSANNGRSAFKWKMIKEQLCRLKFQRHVTIEYDLPFDLESCITEMIKTHGIYNFVSGGGDGSVNYLLNSLKKMADCPLENFSIGAIGLGSSNDFLKPFGNGSIDNIPVRLDVHNSLLSDIGQVRYKDEHGNVLEHLFIINASIGLLAKGNYLFNKGDWIINYLKKMNVNLAIEFTGIKTLITHHASRLNIESDKETKNVNLTSLSVIKSPFISGNYKFNQSILPDDGLLGINYSYNENFFDIVQTMSDLKKGQFIQEYPHKNRQSYLSTYCKVITRNYEFLETDGEVTLAKDIEFSIYKEKIKLMGCGV